MQVVWSLNFKHLEILVIVSILTERKKTLQKGKTFLHLSHIAYSLLLCAYKYIRKSICAYPLVLSFPTRVLNLIFLQS